jgi:hypothetical protein
VSKTFGAQDSILDPRIQRVVFDGLVGDVKDGGWRRDGVSDAWNQSVSSKSLQERLLGGRNGIESFPFWWIGVMDCDGCF